MTAWAQSLIRISNYEVETLQKRLAEVAARKAEAEMRVAVLDAEVEIERQNARLDPASGMMLQAYLHGWKQRRADAEMRVRCVRLLSSNARLLNQLIGRHHFASPAPMRCQTSGGSGCVISFSILTASRRRCIAVAASASVRAWMRING